jgi:exodeoxyribonuclease VII small subunit
VKSSPSEKLSFEKALEKLESIVADMESGEIPLETMIERFEEGNKLLAICGQRLRNAEQKIELLKKNRDGLSFENLDPDQS